MYVVRLNFLWDDGNDIKTYIISVPTGTSLDRVKREILEVHEFLCKEGEDGLYETNGRDSDTLMEYVCEKNLFWHYKEFECDIDLELE